MRSSAKYRPTETSYISADDHFAALQIDFASEGGAGCFGGILTERTASIILLCHIESKEKSQPRGQTLLCSYRVGTIFLGATSSLPVQRRIGQGDAAPPGPAANRPMTKSKRPMSKRHEPHDQNKTAHEETGRTAAVAGSIEKRRSRRGRPTILV